MHEYKHKRPSPPTNQPHTPNAIATKYHTLRDISPWKRPTLPVSPTKHTSRRSLYYHTP
ncbi:hypothetical protein EJ05DRAFT_478605 [Pseudovirgaria hyperparasitica]|uniref:Uncharacterized protein n=1 Tax=Pseudovirgaria hyperparasitica TaxID=470096 RepID=A0A6A6W0X5_9PEZI|nr:uncharacterized protein EJ05DRAFT_478605 [Pseudovirgaria hyperparasitica]KAF2755634.1 hypothetical protein EJ05DRAFT_478605 [Pseudovirgaria hyperparasitica]